MSYMKELKEFKKTLWEMVVLIYESYGYTCEKLDLEYFYNSMHRQEMNALDLAFKIANRIHKKDYDEEIIDELIDI